jgi:hypothetical protein
MGCRQIGDLADRLPCRRDDEAWTVAAVMVSRCRLSCVFGLVRCAWAAAGICRSQARHFEGIFILAGVEYFLRLRRAVSGGDNNG